MEQDVGGYGFWIVWLVRKRSDCETLSALSSFGKTSISNVLCIDCVLLPLTVSSVKLCGRMTIPVLLVTSILISSLAATQICLVNQAR